MNKESILKNLKRYPKTKDKSLQPWSNAELLAYEYVINSKKDKIHLFNDRFGVWNCLLHQKKTTSIITYASQEKAIIQNLKSNKLPLNFLKKQPLDRLKSVELAIIKVPKSLELLELFLQQTHKASSENTEVVCCFMTKYFSSSILKLSSIYFEDIEQSKAWKKARLLILKKPKKIEIYKNTLHLIKYKNTQIKQYFGVFSSQKIDIGTQFLLEHFTLKPEEKKVLDLACGNGIIGLELTNQNPSIAISLIDDFNLAIASSKRNIKTQEANFIWDNNLNQLPKNHFDLVISNPPFHFEYENNIEVSLSLFKQAEEVLNENGRFVLVANKHLNYSTHLKLLFNRVIKTQENYRFEILECSQK